MSLPVDGGPADGTDVADVARALVAELTARGETVAVAESLTGGKKKKL